MSLKSTFEIFLIVAVVVIVILAKIAQYYGMVFRERTRKNHKKYFNDEVKPRESFLYSKFLILAAKGQIELPDDPILKKYIQQYRKFRKWTFIGLLSVMPLILFMLLYSIFMAS